MRTSKEFKKQKLPQLKGGCKALCCSCSCRLSISSCSEEAESSGLDQDQFESISNLTHIMVQERLDRMIRDKRQEAIRNREQEAIRNRERRDKQIRRSNNPGTKFIVMVAMEKCSYDPKEDFRESMVEMIMANRIEGTKDLRRLLNYYLSMNSQESHGIILEVFYEVCAYLFSSCKCY